MIKWILKQVYKKNPGLYTEVVCEEFLGDIPKEVELPAMSLLASERNSIERWLNYQAYLTVRMSISNPKRADFFQGALAYIKVFQKTLLSHGKKGEHKEGLGDVKTMEEYKKEQQEKLEDDLTGVENFTKRQKRANPQVD